MHVALAPADRLAQPPPRPPPVNRSVRTEQVQRTFHTCTHTQTHKAVNACTLTHNKTPPVNVYRSHCGHGGRKWTQRSGQLDVTDLRTITTGRGGGGLLVESKTNNRETSEQCPGRLPAVVLLFHYFQCHQMFGGSVICM